jgi:hypothetical protein
MGSRRLRLDHVLQIRYTRSLHGRGRVRYGEARMARVLRPWNVERAIGDLSRHAREEPPLL